MKDRELILPSPIYSEKGNVKDVEPVPEEIKVREKYDTDPQAERYGRLIEQA